jgi:hypothetical protein
VNHEDQLRREVFFLAYHLHWPPDQITGLPTAERWAYVRLLSEQLEQERKQVTAARNRR